MDKQDAQKIVNYLQDVIGDEDAKVIEDYSGRCMYGRTTVAVETQYPIWFGYAAKAVDVDITYSEPRTDDLGFNTVIYFYG